MEMPLSPAAPLTDLTKDLKGSYAEPCFHSFEMVKSDNALMQWTCRDCQWGPS
ncbi:hypothetical protein N658DRAFT_142968 [Parathielavia hyrcaniae]|uniref:Uncharacterized protein n=1 Tax=Parathielavia hyrcaniae TaxID=113614 RepID=A0AAN6SWK7_9PEZI|nr:hypothetical protein N658DRAFT_142968 [Parathielavia hyrcaniae]